MIELERVSKNYGPVPALRDVSFHVGEKETVGLLGRNGAGKTTLLNIMTGYFPPSEGNVRIGGKSMKEEAAACKRNTLQGECGAYPAFVYGAEFVRQHAAHQRLDGVHVFRFGAGRTV